MHENAFTIVFVIYRLFQKQQPEVFLLKRFSYKFRRCYRKMPKACNLLKKKL